MLRTELDGLTMHAELLKSLAWGHQVSGITRALRCLIWPMSTARWNQSHRRHTMKSESVRDYFFHTTTRRVEE